MQRKLFVKIQYPFKIKTLQKVSIKGAYLKKIKPMCNKLTANITLDEKLKTSPLRSEQDSGVHFATIIQHSFGNLTHGNH